MNPTSEKLVETLRLAQRLGFFGRGSIDAVVEQGELFAEGLEPLGSGARVVDLGSGGGSPGLIAASCRGDLSFTLIDRRRKRTDFLERAVKRLGLSNVEVLCDDVVALRSDVTSGVLSPFDGLTARGFGPFPLLVQSIVDLLADDGVAVVSDPPGSNRWTPGAIGDAPVHTVARRGVDASSDGGVTVLRRSTAS